MRKNADSLYDLALRFYEKGKRAIVPLFGYSGLQLTGTTIKQNQFNHLVQFRSLSRLYDRFRPDAMFFLMDLSVEASALGLPVRFPLEETPSVEAHLVKSKDDLDKFRKIDILGDGRVIVYLETLKHMRAAFPCPVGAYVIGPLTLSGLLMGAKQLAIKRILEPDFFEEVLEFSHQVVMRYAQALRENGADSIMALDPTAVIFGPQQFRQTISRFYREMVGILDDVEITLHVCGNTFHLLEEMVDSGVTGLSLDSLVDMREASQVTGEDILLMGNVSPVKMLFGSPQEVYDETWDLLESMRDFPPFILSTGCDLPQDVPLENIDAFFQAGRNWGK